MSNQQKPVMDNKKGYFRILPLGLSISVLATSAIGFFTTTLAAQAKSLDNPTTTEQNSHASIIAEANANFFDDLGGVVIDTLKTGAAIGGGVLQQRFGVQPAPSYQQPAPSYQQPAPSYQQPAPSYQQPAPSYQQPTEDSDE
jgi:hypothetical protein